MVLFKIQIMLTRKGVVNGLIPEWTLVKGKQLKYKEVITTFYKIEIIKKK